MSRPKLKPRSVKATLVRVQFDQSLKSSLIHLPMCLYAPLVDRGVAPQSLVVEIDSMQSSSSTAVSQQAPSPYYAGWTGMSAAPLPVASTFSSASSSSSSPSSVTDVISLSPSLAASFTPPLSEGVVCSVRLLRSPPLPTASKVQVTPISPDDWEILSIHAEDVEINMLGQVRAARVGQVIGVHVGRLSKTIVRFRVDATTPPTSSPDQTEADQDNPSNAANVAVRLSTDTEVIIAPRLRKTVQEPSGTEQHELNGAAKASIHASGSDAAEQRTTLSKLLWRVLPPSFSRLPAHEEWLQNAVLLPPSLGHSSPSFCADSLQHLFPNGRIAVTKLACPSTDATQDPAAQGAAAASGSRSQNGAAHDQGTQGAQPANTLPSRPTASAYFASGDGYQRSQVKSSWPDRHIVVGSALRKQLGINDYDLVRLTAPPPGSNPRASSTTDRATDEQASDQESSEASSLQETKLAGVDQIFEKCLDAVTSSLQSRRLLSHHGAARSKLPFSGSSGLLLSGGPGSGKTVVAQEIASRLSSDLGLLVSTSRIDCSPFSEERVPVLRARFSEWLNEAAWKAPSLLVLDNIDRIIPAEVEHVDSQRSRQLAEALVARVRECVKDYEVFVLATAQNSTSIHSLLNSSHLWIDNVQLKPPSKEGRREIISHLVRNKIQHAAKGKSGTIASSSSQEHDLNFVTLATLTEGYLPADLKDLVERAVHQSAIRAASEADSLANAIQAPSPKTHVANGTCVPSTASEEASDFHLTMADFVKAQEGFTPLSLRDVKLEKSSVAWSDIGGLAETRRVLRETLEWPTKYAAIFASCPLRLRSGLLLYGYPGCGKTLLASAVAKECGLNFISVKGPEILNKYIGASEKSVRDLFDRAQAAKPCVLFFDEFDSIAPKRGHDSTGVTDRVVNQMLTQMDGAEGLDGVYVLAATSRPDLIDSALLRPGRLDKSLLCDMPSLEDRVDIIKAIARKVHLDSSVDVEKWAKRTEGFSGADLQALLYNAHLETIHESINAVSMNGAEEGADKKDGQDGSKPLKFISFGGGAGASKKTLSGAEQQALSRKLDLVLSSQRQAQATAAASRRGAGSASGATESNGTTAAPTKGSKKVLVNDAHLESSLKATRPSVPVEEQKRLRRIYKAFAGERDAHFPDGEASDQIGARSSLM